ncbi:MAG: alpha/beta fold hydrolase [Vicinamibacterales bacterium]
MWTTHARCNGIRTRLAACTAAALLGWGSLQGPLAPRILAAQRPAPDINMTSFVSVGGIDQWISIRGLDRRNPVLLVVHGGPGEAQWPVADKYEPWLRAFTVVLWDQRGAGHTYGRYRAQTPDFSLDRIARDGIEVAEFLRRTLGKKTVVVLGHSWGSIVAVEMVQRRPDLFAAYVGTGQVASWKATMNQQFALALSTARQHGDAAAVAALAASGPPDPADPKQAFSVDIRPAMAAADRAWLQSLRAGAPALKAAHPKDFQDFEDGFQFSAARALPDQMRTDLPATATTFALPFFVIQGRDDVMTPTKAAVDYFHGVTAPTKQLILIPDAGHFAFMTSQAFLAALVDTVRPVAVANGA